MVGRFRRSGEETPTRVQARCVGDGMGPDQELGSFRHRLAVVRDDHDPRCALAQGGDGSPCHRRSRLAHCQDRDPIAGRRILLEQTADRLFRIDRLEGGVQQGEEFVETLGLGGSDRGCEVDETSRHGGSVPRSGWAELGADVRASTSVSIEMWLTLIRHAEPAYVVDGISYTDPPLTERGREQAILLAKRVSRWSIDEIWVSGMVRAQQTAEPLVEATGIEPQVMEWLNEIRNPPEWDGSPADEIEEFFATSQNRSVEEMWEGAPGGESFRDFHKRIHSGIEETFAERGITQTGDHHLWQGVDDRRVVVVAHGGTNALIIGKLLGVEPTPWEWDRFTHVHSGVSRLLSQPTAGYYSWSLRALSDRSHLPPEMVTA